MTTLFLKEPFAAAFGKNINQPLRISVHAEITQIPHTTNSQAASQTPPILRFFISSSFLWGNDFRYGRSTKNDACRNRPFGDKAPGQHGLKERLTDGRRGESHVFDGTAATIFCEHVPFGARTDIQKILAIHEFRKQCCGSHHVEDNGCVRERQDHPTCYTPEHEVERRAQWKIVFHPQDTQEEILQQHEGHGNEEAFHKPADIHSFCTWFEEPLEDQALGEQDRPSQRKDESSASFYAHEDLEEDHGQHVDLVFSLTISAAATSSAPTATHLPEANLNYPKLAGNKR